MAISGKMRFALENFNLYPAFLKHIYYFYYLCLFLSLVFGGEQLFTSMSTFYSAIYLTTKGALDFFSVADRHLGAHSIYSSPGNNIWHCSFRKYLFPTLSLHGLSGANFPPSLPSCVNSHPSLVGEDTSLHPIPAIVTGSGMGNKIQSWSSHWNYWKR